MCPLPRRFPILSQIFGNRKLLGKQDHKYLNKYQNRFQYVPITFNNKLPEFKSPREIQFANITNCARPGVIIEEFFNTNFKEQPECSDQSIESDHYTHTHYNETHLVDTYHFKSTS